MKIRAVNMSIFAERYIWIGKEGVDYMAISTDKTGNTVAAVKVPHTIQIDRRKRTVITGVMDVCSFHETEIIMRLESGHLFLTGQGLHIGKLLPEENRLDVEGQVDSLIYEQPGKLAIHRWPWQKKNG